MILNISHMQRINKIPAYIHTSPAHINLFCLQNFLPIAQLNITPAPVTKNIYLILHDKPTTTATNITIIYKEIHEFIISILYPEYLNGFLILSFFTVSPFQNIRGYFRSPFVYNLLIIFHLLQLQ